MGVDPTSEDMAIMYRYATCSCIINDKLSYNNYVQNSDTLLSLLSHLILFAIIFYPFPLFFLVIHQPCRYLIVLAHAVLSNFFKPDKDLVERRAWAEGKVDLGTREREGMYSFYCPFPSFTVRRRRLREVESGD